MLKRKIVGVMLIYAFLLPALTFGQAAQAVYDAPKETIDKIKDEGMNRSQVMDTLSYLTDVIGPRLTASPGMKRANNWTRDTLEKWGLQNAHLESWGPFGRGWTLKRFYANVDGPTAFPLIAYPKAWSPGTDTLKKGANTAYTGEVIYFNPTNEAELNEFKGKLKGKIVLVGAMREIKAHFEPQGTRATEKELLDMADAPDPASIRRAAGTGGPRGGNAGQAAQFNSLRFRFLSEEGAAVLIDAGRGDGGTVFVQGAAAVQPAPVAGQAPVRASVYDKSANVPIQISAAGEHFNRLVRTLNAGEKVTMTVDLAVEYQDADLNGYNTIAEIPGTDLKDEVVMLGGHLDSWQSGTGATDNGAGCAVMMEAVRILHTLGLKPRRTIRIALWSGEEQGLHGSRAYVKQHFGYFGDGTTPAFGGGGGGQNQAPRTLTKLADYDKLSAYFNIDNGTGKVRGVYMQGNENVRPIFRSWLAPFKEMGANTLTLSNTGGTDHLSFDGIGLPGFQFIQDEVEYSSRTHHSNMDVFDRIQADDMKQMSIILASFVYQTAMMDQKMPKKGN
ncbi:MAG: M20/M25/M40 family metallo-hydrolase [Pyrinomonadaceae bacterium]